ncbi:MAG: hypothetical protein CM15mP84_07230 [Cellvibrionales bacterium]|nr:MAG: hypothetical protein CM15mP84_07230 [Cellvibrionales bacterium]
MYCLAGYVLPRIAGQKGNRRSDIRGLAQTTEWNLCLQASRCAVSNARVISVSIKPGATQFTVIDLDPSSRREI